MNIKQIIFALIVIGSQSALAQVAAGTTTNTEELTINASLDTSVAGSVAKMQGQNQLESEARKDTTGNQAVLPATINEVASGLQSKLDQRMKIDFEHQNTLRPTFAIAY